MQVQVIVNNILYKTYEVETSPEGYWDPKPINMAILNDRKMGLLDGFEPITEIKLLPIHP